ncbi:hypothetical protein I4U23_026734 [Adineta vaga]|nr:hypothetical protein I4U23_026734 [Adineta vaga]
MVLNTLWTQIEVVELTNDGTGLGFGISGNKSTGVVVKAIVPGSIADKDGRIRTGDHLFQINHVYVRGMSAEQVAGILRQCPEQVRVVIARSVREPQTANSSSPTMSQRPSLTSENLIQSRHPSSPMILDNDGIINSSQNKIILRTERLLESNHNLEKILDNLLEQCQAEEGTQILDVTLEKGDDGLGITVAGYVSPDSTNNDAIAGIFIRDIAEGSVCSRDGSLAIGDQIIEVNDQSLNGFSNVQALYLLQNTSASVRLKVRRYIDGVKHEKIKEMISLESSQPIEVKVELQNQLNLNDQINQKWMKSLGNNYEIIIVDLYKPDNGSLGITLEGTIDVENGEEVGAHHYIRTLLSEGIIEREGTLKSGDELLEINNQILYGKNHINVIEIIKRVRHQIKLVCARRKLVSQSNEINANLASTRSRSISFGKTTEIVVKAKSLGTLVSNNTSFLRITKTRSLEVISNLALWSTSILNIELIKSEHGLGFSVLDYQDPSNPSYSPVIVIRALVPGGVAQIDGRIVPGDRLVAVNDITLENMNLDEVIKILKSTPKGPVKLSLSKPLPYPKFKNDNDDKIVTDSEQNGHGNRRLSRISKSRTTTEMINNHKRSVSSHRSVKNKPAVSNGIALSAPAILTRHEYPETLLTKENANKRTEHHFSSAIHRHKTSKRTFPSKKSYQSDLCLPTINLPEFIQFQSDHLLFLSYRSYDRLRSPLTNSISKLPRQSTTSQTTSTKSASKRLSRSRHSYDASIPHHKQRKSSKRSSTNKFDSMSCFNEADLSSDDTNLIRSSSLSNRYLAKTTLQSADVKNDVVCMADENKELDDLSNNNPINQTSTCISSSKQSSRMASPVLSSSSRSSGHCLMLANPQVIELPVELQREIVIKHDFDQLNLIVDPRIDNGINGCCIQSLTSMDTGLHPGDFIVSISNENMRQISNAQACAIIRRASLIRSDISIIFICGIAARNYREQLLISQEVPSDGPGFDTEFTDETATTPPRILDTENLCSTLWGPARTVVLHRDKHVKSLGISIVGGKLDFSGPGNTIESCISGIFIKHVIPDSLAGRHSTLKTGDRILEVNGYNLRDATHDHAVDIIRSAKSPIYFSVQSLLDPSTQTAAHVEQDENIQLFRQYEHLNGEVLLIDIKRNSIEMNEPLGISLIGHRDPDQLAVFVCDIQANSLFDRDNRLQIGDQLLQVNDEILFGKSHSIVTSIIKSIPSENLNFIILRNPNAIHDMALRQPYTISPQHTIPLHVKFTSVENDSQTTKRSFNLIKTTNDVESSKDIPSTQTNSHSSISDVKPCLFNQRSVEFSPTSSDMLTNVNEDRNHPIMSDVILPIVTKQRRDLNTNINGTFVSHIPMMSSSSSSSSLSIPTPTPTSVKNDIHVDESESVVKMIEKDEIDLRTRPILMGQETLIEIDRGQLGLGLSVVGGFDTQLSGIIIHDIYQGCAAQRDGRLLVGDQILEVNSIDLRSATHEQAIQALRQSKTIVRMLILRGEVVNEEDKFDIITVDFMKKAGKGLGFSIIGRRHGYGVFISHIIENSSAEKDGRLMSGDLILEVNGKDLRTAAYEQVAFTLKTLPHERVYIKVGRLKANAHQNFVPIETNVRSRSPSANPLNAR